MSNTIFVFMLILGAAFAFSTLLSQIPILRIPSAISYLVFGILLHAGVVYVSPEELNWLRELGDVGLLFLMFLSGMEVDVRLLRPTTVGHNEANPLYQALSIFCGTLLISFVLSLLIAKLMGPPTQPYMVALLFATTSLGVILPILEEAEILHTNLGQTLLLSALVADLITMFLVSLYVSVRATGDVWSFLLAFAVIPFAGLVYFGIQWLRKVRYARRLAGDVQSRMRAIVALVACACAFADFTGAEPILGSFLVGILVSAVPFAFKRTLRDYAHGLGYGFLIPIFFISVGLDFQVQSFGTPNAWLWVPALVVVAFVVKLVPAWQLRKHYGRKMALASGMLLSSRLSLVVAAAEIGVRIGALPEFLSQTLVVVAVLTCLIAPISFLSSISV